MLGNMLQTMGYFSRICLADMDVISDSAKLFEQEIRRVFEIIVGADAVK